MSFEDETTTELLALPLCKVVVARFAGMEDLSAFDSNPEKLANLVTAIQELREVPESLTLYSLDQIHHAGEMIRWAVLKDHDQYDGIMSELLGLDLGDDDACGD